MDSSQAHNLNVGTLIRYFQTSTPPFLLYLSCFFLHYKHNNFFTAYFKALLSLGTQLISLRISPGMNLQKLFRLQSLVSALSRKNRVNCL